MATFKLEILTPKRQFFTDDVTSVTVTLPDGEMTVLAHHAPLLASLEVGYVKINTGDEIKTAYSAEGFIEIRPDEVLIFTQECEWPDEIDAHRAEEEKEAAEEQMRQKQSLIEYKQTRLALSKAMARLRVKGTHEVH